MGRVRRGKRRAREIGFIVSWDVNSVDRTGSRRLQYFMFGTTVVSRNRLYRYAGFLDRDGVRYLGQSVVFVRPPLLAEIERFLSANGIDHEATPAILG